MPKSLHEPRSDPNPLEIPLIWPSSTNLDRESLKSRKIKPNSSVQSSHEESVVLTSIGIPNSPNRMQRQIVRWIKIEGFLVASSLNPLDLPGGGSIPPYLKNQFCLKKAKRGEAPPLQIKKESGNRATAEAIKVSAFQGLTVEELGGITSMIGGATSMIGGGSHGSVGIVKVKIDAVFNRIEAFALLLFLVVTDDYI